MRGSLKSSVRSLQVTYSSLLTSETSKLSPENPNNKPKQSSLPLLLSVDFVEVLRHFVVGGGSNFANF